MMRIWGSAQKCGPIGNFGGRKFPTLPIRNPVSSPNSEIGQSVKLIKPNRLSVADHPFEALRKLVVAASSESIIKVFSIASRKMPNFSVSMIAVAGISQNTKASLMRFLLYKRNCGFSYKKSYDEKEAIISVANAMASLFVAGIYYAAGYWIVFVDPLSEHPSVSDLRKELRLAHEKIEEMEEEHTKDDKMAKEDIKHLKEEMAAMKEDLQESKNNTWLRWLMFWKSK